MTHTRIHWRILGGHVHTDWFSGKASGLPHGKNGDLIFTLAEWETLKPIFAHGMGLGIIELVESQ